MFEIIKIFACGLQVMVLSNAVTDGNDQINKRINWLAFAANYISIELSFSQVNRIKLSLPMCSKLKKLMLMTVLELCVVSSEIKKSGLHNDHVVRIITTDIYCFIHDIHTHSETAHNFIQGIHSFYLHCMILSAKEWTCLHTLEKAIRN